MEKNKKYLIKESELKEIIQEMILMELYDPNAFTANFKNGQRPQGINLGRALDALRKVPGKVIPDDWQEKAANGDWGWFTQWLLGSVGAVPDGQGAPDYVPNISTGFKGLNYDAHEPLNVSEAVRWIMANSTPYYIKNKNGHCARRVREALNHGGLSLPSGVVPATEARHYLRILPANGWYKIDKSQAGAPGDVMVMDKCEGHPNGHIAMCCGNGLWVSDFKQKSMVGSATPVDENMVFVFRYRNIVG